MSILDQYRDQSLENAGLRAQLAQVKATSGAEIKRLRRVLIERAQLAEESHKAFERAARKDMITIGYSAALLGFFAGVAVTLLIPA